MGSHTEKSVNWTCDRRGCNNHGMGGRIPNDWRYVQMFPPHNTPGGPNSRETALLCPSCYADVKVMVDWMLKDGTKAMASVQAEANSSTNGVVAGGLHAKIYKYSICVECGHTYLNHRDDGLGCAVERILAGGGDKAICGCSGFKNAVSKSLTGQ